MLKIILMFIYVTVFSFVQAQENIKVTITKGILEDDSKIFKEALNKKGGDALKITVKKGHYIVTSSLWTSRPNTSIIFEKGAVIYFSSNTSSGFTVQHDNFLLDGAHINGNGVSAKDYYTGFGVLLNGASRCVIKNSTFESISGNNILFYPRSNVIGCNNNLVLNNLFISPAFDMGGIGDEAAIMLGYSGEGYTHNNNIIKDNTIDGNYKLKIGAGIIAHGKNNSFINNKIINCRHYGIIMYESKDKDTTLYNNLIKNNIICNIGEVNPKKTVKGMGIYLMKCSTSIVTGNRVYNTLRNSDETETLGAGAISISLSPNTIVSNNFVDGSYMYGLVSDYSFGSKFIKNTVQNTRKSGAYFMNMNDILVTGNTFKNIGAVVLRGYFEDTSLPYIKEQMSINKYKNINTGNNFRIVNNKFFTDKDVLYFIGTPGDKDGKFINKIRNNLVENNQIIGNPKKQEELIHFRQEVSGSNNIRNNKQTN
jgi:hypothetical protein